MRPYQIATAAVIVLIAAVAMFDTRSGALPDTSGGAPGGLRGGWYPFWSATVMSIAALVIAYRTLVTPQPASGVFKDRQGVVYVVRLVLPMIALVLLMAWPLGFYLSAALYSAWFAFAVGRYRWHWAAAMTVLIPVATYLLMEIAFKTALPRSIFFTMGLPF